MAPRRRRAELPALLHDHDAGRGPGRGAVGVRRVPPRDRPLVRRGSRRRAARRPPGRPARPGRVPRGPGPPHRRRLRARREDPRARRGIADLVGDRGHDRLRRARAHRPGAGRPGRAGSARRPGGAAARRTRRLGLAHPRHQAGCGRRRTAGRGTADRAGGRPRPGRRRRGARLLPRLPLVPPAGPRAPRPGAGRRARAPPRPGHRARRARAGAVRPDPPGGAAVPADERDGDGQGRRGLRVLPLLPAHVPQRGRRRPGGLLRRTCRLPRGDGRAAARLARRDDRRRRPTTPSAARTPGPGSP